MIFWSLLTFLQLFAFSNAQIPCDEQYGEHCPSASSWGVGTCLSALGDDVLPADCKNFISVHEACRSDIDTHCTGKEYTSDLMVCLSEWTKPDSLSEECSAALPKKELKERVMTEKEKEKAAMRRKRRNDAANLANKQAGKDKDSKKKDKKKSKKDKKVDL